MRTVTELGAGATFASAIGGRAAVLTGHLGEHTWDTPRTIAGCRQTSYRDRLSAVYRNARPACFPFPRSTGWRTSQNAHHRISDVFVLCSHSPHGWSRVRELLPSWQIDLSHHYAGRRVLRVHASWHDCGRHRSAPGSAAGELSNRGLQRTAQRARVPHSGSAKSCTRRWPASRIRL